MMMKIVKPLLLTLAIILIAWYLSNNSDFFARIGRISMFTIIELSALILLSMILLGLRFKIVIKALGTKLTFHEWFGLTIIGTLLNYFPFRAGLFLRGYYLKKLKKVPYTQYLSGMFFAEFIMMLTALILLTILVGFGYTHLDSTKAIGIILGILLLISLLVISLFIIPKKFRTGILGQYVNSIKEGNSIIGSFSFSLILLILINCFFIVSFALRLVIASKEIGVSLPFSSTLIIASLAVASAPFYIIPGGLGIKEALAGAGASLSGNAVNTGIMPTLVDRAVSFLWILIIGGIYQFWLSKRYLLDQKDTNENIQKDTSDSKTFSQTYPDAQSLESRMQKAKMIEAILAEELSKKDIKSCVGIDLGCGIGVIASHLSQRVKSVIGFDLDLIALKEGTQYLKSNQPLLAHGDSLVLPIKTASVDFIICNHIYEHVSDANKLLEEISRILKQDGLCYFGAANALFPKEPHTKLWGIHWLPRSVANAILGNKGPYTEQLKSYFSLKKLVQKFHYKDYTISVLKEPQKYNSFEAIPLSYIFTLLPRPLLALLCPLSQTLIWVLRKKSEAKL